VVTVVTGASKKEVIIFRDKQTNTAESARAVTGTQCPHSGEGEGFLTRQPDFFYENGCNLGTESRKIVPKVENERSLRVLQTGR